MPSSPKVCNRLCDVGIVKVFKKLESQHIAKTASHIGGNRKGVKRQILNLLTELSDIREVEKSPTDDYDKQSVNVLNKCRTAR